MAEYQHDKSIGPANSDDRNNAPPPGGKNYLLAIGIDNYVHCPRLYNAVKDVQDLVAVLTTRFRFDRVNVKMLLDRDATKRNIYAAFEDFAEKITPADNFIIYFSGHGEYKKVFELGYWISVEAERNAADQYIPNSEIRNILSAIKSHHTFLLVDSCFSGALFAKGAGKNVSLRKERDPSRWGLTAGRNEVVTDGKPGDNSPFAKSILYELQHADKPIGAAELCDKVLEVVAANADQTPRGEPLKVDGHQGGQFVFHLRQDEAADWKAAMEKGDLAALHAFVSQYPEGEYAGQAKREIKKIEAAELWRRIAAAPEASSADIGQKLQLINAYAAKYDGMPHYEEALDLGELLEYKRHFLQAKHSEFSLRKFLQRDAPDLEAVAAIRREARALLDAGERDAAANERTREAEEEQRAQEKAAARKKQAGRVTRYDPPQRQTASPFPLGRYALIGGGVLALLLAIYLLPELFPGGRGSEGMTPSRPLTEKRLPEMIAVQGGSFTMGSPETEEGRDDDECQHQLSVQSFEIGKYEVTQAEWRAVMGSDPPELHNKGCDDCPVENVSWNDVQVFLKKLNAWHPGKNYRLLTEAEWEYAARGGRSSQKYKYAGSDDLGEVAWYGDNYQSANSYGAKKNTHPVGRKKANELGIFDMSGNVWEWCQDSYKPYPCDSKNTAEGSYRVFRGGGWFSHPQSCRAANRDRFMPTVRSDDFGFRLARSSF